MLLGIAFLLQLSDKLYSIERSWIGRNRIVVRIVEPKGYNVKIYRHNKLVLEGTIPLRFSPKLGGYYRFVVEGVFDGRIYLKKGYEHRISFKVRKKKKGYRIKIAKDFFMLSRDYEGIRVGIDKPEGFKIRVIDSFGKKVYEGTIPAYFHLQREGRYKLQLIGDGQVLWERTFKFSQDREIGITIKISPLTKEKFRKLLSELEKQEIDEDRLVVLEQALDSKHITVNQLLEILDRFELDESRLEVVKFAYPKILDKDNIFLVYSKFKHSSTKDEFRRWLEHEEEGSEGGWIEGWD